MKRIHLELALAIEKTKMLKDAALLLNRNPSNISRMLVKLQEETECTLFSYQNHLLEPTPEGKVFLSNARKLTELFNELDLWIEKQKESERNGKQKESVSKEKQKKADSKELPPQKGAMDIHKESLTKENRIKSSAKDTQSSPYNWTDREIEYLIIIESNRNISKAAEQLYISQPALSQFLSGINRLCGFRIFLATKEGLVLSERGHVFYEFIHKISVAFASLKEELDEFHDFRRGTVKVGIPRNLGTSLIPMIVPPFLKQFPGIHLRILENNSERLKELLAEKKLDLAILHLEDSKDIQQGHYQFHYQESFCLVIPKNWKDRLKLPENRPLTAQDLLALKDESFVLVAKRMPIRNVVEHIFERVRQLTNEEYEPIACCSTKNMETVRRLVVAESGITFSPESYISLYYKNDELINYPLSPELEASWSVALMLPDEEKVSRCSKELIEIIKKSL